MLQLATDGLLFESVLKLFKHIDIDWWATVVSLELVDHFKERCLVHPETYPDIVIKLSILDGFHDLVLGRQLCCTLADFPQGEDVWHCQKLEETTGGVGPWSLSWVGLVGQGVEVITRAEVLKQVSKGGW